MGAGGRGGVVVVVFTPPVGFKLFAPVCNCCGVGAGGRGGAAVGGVVGRGGAAVGIPFAPTPFCTGKLFAAG